MKKLASIVIILLIAVVAISGKIHFPHTVNWTETVSIDTFPKAYIRFSKPVVLPPPVNDYVGSYSLTNETVGSSFAANSMTNFYNTSGTKSGGTYTFTDANGMFLRGKQQSRDADITFALQHGYVFFRINSYRQTYYVGVNGSSSITLGICTDTAVPPPYYNVLRTWNGADATAIFSTVGDGSGLITIEERGFDITLKYNGVQFYTGKEFYLLEAGGVAVRGDGSGAMYHFEVNHLPRLSLASNTDAGEINLIDWGIKTNANTTGSISAGSHTLSVADASHYVVGETLIISPTTGKGSYGPGKGWPLRSYSSTTAMNADLSRANDTYAGNVQTGRVNKYDAANSLWYEKGYTGTVHEHDHFFDWYEAYIRPHALVSRITAINYGTNTITLADTSFVSVSGAAVYLDQWAFLSRFTDVTHDSYGATYPFYPGENAQGREFLPTLTNPRKLIIPSGEYAMSQRWNIRNKPNWTIKGASDTTTHIFSPKGVKVLLAAVVASPNIIVENLFLEGNGGDDDWAVSQGEYSGNGQYNGNKPTETNYQRLEHALTSGISFGGGSDGAIIRKSKLKNFLAGYVSFSANNCVAEDLYEIREYGNHDYITWDNVSPFGVNCIFRRINYNNTGTIVGAFEGYGTTNCVFEDLNVRGGKFSNNSSDGIRFRRINVTLGENSIATWDKADDQIFNINTNAYGHSADNELDSITIYIEGYMSPWTLSGDPSGRQTMRGFVVQGSVSNAVIKNCKYLLAPSIENLTTTRSIGFSTDATDVVFDNIEVNGYNSGEAIPEGESYFNASQVNIGLSAGTIKNSKARTLGVTPFVTRITNTITRTFVYTP